MTNNKKDFPSNSTSGTNTIEIIQGIAQAVANSHDGAHTEDGKGEGYQEIGLKREELKDFRDRRIMDGFKVAINGNTLILSYQSEIALKDVYEKKFENEILDTLEECISFIKKEYKKITKKALSLKMIDEPDIKVEHMNKIRSWVTAKSLYTIDGIELHNDSLEKSWKERLAPKTREWLGIEKD